MSAPNPSRVEQVIEGLRDLRKALWPAKKIGGDGSRVRHVEALDAAIEALASPTPSDGEPTEAMIEAGKRGLNDNFELLIDQDNDEAAVRAIYLAMESARQKGEG